MRNIIIGTAGHVDHGKTEIVKALTGRDTDRLSEEKERGISIVLGFAPLDMGEGINAGVVDVPGHERFVKNMVSGAVGVDLALLVIAADEGVMPQTEEHLEVLRLLGVKLGVVALTKADLVDDEVIEVVESEVRDLLGEGFPDDVPFIRTSVVTGQGLDELKRVLKVRAEEVRERRLSDFFRMPVDRIFTRSGIGTIVTGSTWGGSAGKGDELVIEPIGRKVRLREVQSFDRVLEKASPGMRIAIALHGVRSGEVSIGQQLLTPGVLQTSSMLDTVIELSRLPGSALKNRQRIRFHHAAAEIIARVVLLDSEKLEAGGRGYVQLRLEKPTVARGGDRFIVRSYSPMRVIAGGKVLDPVPPKAKRFREQTIETLRLLDSESGEETVLGLASRRKEHGLAPEELRRYGMTLPEAAESCERLECAGKVYRVGRLFLLADVIHGIERRMIGIAERFAAGNPLRWGIDKEELREKTGAGDAALFSFLLDRGLEQGCLFIKGGRVRAGSGEMDLSEKNGQTLVDIENRIRAAGFSFLRKDELLDCVGDEKKLISFLRLLRESGSVIRIGSDGYMHGEFHRKLLRTVREILLKSGRISVSDFKNEFGFSRKYAVPLLEHLDGEGITRREGDFRIAGPGIGNNAGRD